MASVLLGLLGEVSQQRSIATIVSARHSSASAARRGSDCACASTKCRHADWHRAPIGVGRQMALRGTAPRPEDASGSDSASDPLSTVSSASRLDHLTSSRVSPVCRRGNPTAEGDRTRLIRRGMPPRRTEYRVEGSRSKLWVAVQPTHSTGARCRRASPSSSIGPMWQAAITRWRSCCICGLCICAELGLSHEEALQQRLVSQAGNWTASAAPRPRVA